ncbi:MAG: 3'-5' exonuclease [Bacteroidia bacterium]|nr:3'-5' exonuclease [Bacteroidia bacterium]
MFSSSEVSRILFLDIETVRGEKEFEGLSEEMQEMWIKKAESIKTPEEVSPQDKYDDRAGIYAEFGRIICISFGFVYWQDDQPLLRLKSFYGTDEAEILQAFKELLDNKFDGWKLCAHNGKEFDFPYLCRRYLINQIPLPRMLRVAGKKPWEIPFLDTMELWRFGDYKNYTRLELLCHIFGIPSPKDDVDGSQVGRIFWNENDSVRIARYCEKDVVATVQVLMKYCVLPLVPPENIKWSEI